MTEELEFQISQFADGSLSPDQTRRVAACVESDPAAGKVLAEYQSLDRHFAALTGVGSVDYDGLSARISRQLDEADRPVVAGRIFRHRAVWSAVAAILLLAVGLRVWWPKPVATVPGPTVDRVEPLASSATVTGPQLPVATSRAVVEVTIGPSPAIAAESRYGQSQVVVASRPGTVTIASAARRGDRSPKVR